MKSTQQKARIQEMLSAEFNDENPTEWNAFKKTLEREFAASDTPRFKVTRLKSRYVWALVPAAAALIAIAIALPRSPVTTPLATQAHIAPRNLLAGSTLHDGQRTVAIHSGSAELMRDGKTFRITAESVSADFTLDEPTDLTIQHRLIKVTVTGTRFHFDSTPSGGSIHLRHGRLRLEPLQGRAQELVAPAKYNFGTAITHAIEKPKTRPPAKEHPFYRYELANGEILYGKQIQISSGAHDIELTNGARRVIPLHSIVSVKVTQE